MELSLLVTQAWDDYGLIDSGHGRKLERYGPYRFIRPEPQAMWTPASPDWQAHGEFVGGSEEEGGGRWNLDAKVPQSWPLSRGPLKFWAANTNFRHLAFFPDMAVHWDWMAGRLGTGKDVLNLFGYTGVGTLACAAAGANVTHVDASKKSVAQARENAARLEARLEAAREVLQQARRTIVERLEIEPEGLAPQLAADGAISTQPSWAGSLRSVKYFGNSTLSIGMYRPVMARSTNASVRSTLLRHTNWMPSTMPDQMPSGSLAWSGRPAPSRWNRPRTPTAAIEIGTDWMFSAFFCAVTTISWMPVSAAVSAGVASCAKAGAALSASSTFSTASCPNDLSAP